MNHSIMKVEKGSIRTKFIILEGKEFRYQLGVPVIICSKVPSLVAALLPSSSLMMQEKAWNAYPHCRTGSTKLNVSGFTHSLC